MKVGFIYYTFYPVTGGASVHGFNLAKELYKKGYELFKINGEPDPYTHRLKNPISGLFWILANCDLIYLRMDYFLYMRNFVSILALLSRKKIIVELNNPSDELHLFGRGKKYIQFTDRIISKILKRADAVITVSEPLKRYCEEALRLNNVHVIENGGEIFDDSSDKVSSKITEKLEELKKIYSRTVVWSGSANNMQDLKNLEEIAKSQKGETAVLLLVKDDNQNNTLPVSKENLFVFKNLPREDVKYIISNSDIGLALYKEYPWSRWGFYNSSLKIFEYLNNGLLTITNKEGTEVQKSYPNFKFAGSNEEIITLINEYSDERSFDIEQPRTWEDVAEETSQIIQQILSR
ncbi:MAG: glycosyltransferase [Balneolaceae bacterium]|nr:glycosyltransferase [Balneolaceae bacterium]